MKRLLGFLIVAGLLLSLMAGAMGFNSDARASEDYKAYLSMVMNGYGPVVSIEEVTDHGFPRVYWGDVDASRDHDGDSFTDVLVTGEHNIDDYYYREFSKWYDADPLTLVNGSGIKPCGTGDIVWLRLPRGWAIAVQGRTEYPWHDEVAIGPGTYLYYVKDTGLELVPNAIMHLSDGFLAPVDLDRDGIHETLAVGGMGERLAGSGYDGELHNFYILQWSELQQKFVKVSISNMPKLYYAHAQWVDWGSDGDLDLIFTGMGEDSNENYYTMAGVVVNNGGSWKVQLFPFGVDGKILAYSSTGNGRIDRVIISGYDEGGLSRSGRAKVEKTKGKTFYERLDTHRKQRVDQVRSASAAGQGRVTRVWKIVSDADNNWTVQGLQDLVPVHGSAIDVADVTGDSIPDLLVVTGYGADWAEIGVVYERVTKGNSWLWVYDRVNYVQGGAYGIVKFYASKANGPIDRLIVSVENMPTCTGVCTRIYQVKYDYPEP